MVEGIKSRQKYENSIRTQSNSDKFIIISMKTVIYNRIIINNNHQPPISINQKIYKSDLVVFGCMFANEESVTRFLTFLFLNFLILSERKKKMRKKISILPIELITGNYSNVSLLYSIFN